MDRAQTWSSVLAALLGGAVDVAGTPLGNHPDRLDSS